MGALMRATRVELERCAQDAEWWPGFLSLVSEKGYGALVEVAGESAWSWGAFRQWVRGDEGREVGYQVALRDYAEKCQLERIGIADGAAPETVGVARLRSETRQSVAGKLDRDRWGERIEGNHGGVVPVLVIEIGGVVARVVERDVTPGIGVAGVADEI